MLTFYKEKNLFMWMYTVFKYTLYIIYIVYVIYVPYINVYLFYKTKIL